MNFQSLPRRQDQLVRLGASHGYRVEGDSAFINAELHVPPYCSGSNWSLQLWATEHPHLGGLPTGLEVAEVRLELPTPIGAYVHKVDACTDAVLPARSTPQHMTLVLVGGPADAAVVHDFANYPRPDRFLAPALEGNVGYSIEGGQVSLRADAITNPRTHGNTSGSLSLQLWALPEQYTGGNLARAACLAVADLPSISGQEQVRNVFATVAFSEPPAGRWSVALLLREWTLARGYATRDYRNFDLPYVSADSPLPSMAAEPLPAAAEAMNQRAADKLRLVSAPAALEAQEAPEAVATPEFEATPDVVVVPELVSVPELVAVPDLVGSVESPVASAEVLAAEPVANVVEPVSDVVEPVSDVVEPVGDVVEPVGNIADTHDAELLEAREAAPNVPMAPAPTAEPVAAESTAAATEVEDDPKRVSIQNGKLEELARVKGLNLKVAKEIVKMRPFSSIEDLVNVRGIGEKTLRRIRSLIKL
jgi:competence ComEA-like helix-hairpin-helix protein